MPKTLQQVGQELKVFYGEPSIMISKCLRGFMHAAPGKTLMGGDFSNVESRGIAWLAGEEWKLEAFRECDANPELPDMYERTYGKTFNVDPGLVTKVQRQLGKIEDLAFSYEGGLGAFRTMGKTYNVRVVKHLTPEVVEKAKATKGQVVTEDQVEDFKNGWRNGHERIKGYWFALKNVAMAAIENPGTIYHAGAPGREVAFRKRGSNLWCRLPSARLLCYPYPEIRNAGRYDLPSVTYKGVPDAIVWGIYSDWKTRRDHGEDVGPNPTYIVDEPSNTREWCRIASYGGKLAENITQAICRDVLAEAMMWIEAAGYPVVAHVHDEIIVEGIFTEEDRKIFSGLMTQVPAWAKGFPISADCWLNPRYIKE